MEQVIEFLEKNGFKKKNKSWDNGKCGVFIDDHYTVIFDYGGSKGSVTSENLEIYWLVGLLTWMDLIDKDYVQ